MFLHMQTALHEQYATHDLFSSWQGLNSLELSFTNIQSSYFNFFRCKSFHESNFSDIFSLCEKNLEDSIDYSNFYVKGYLPFIWKSSVFHMLSLLVYVKEGLPFARDLPLENAKDCYLCFQLALLIQLLTSFSSLDHHFFLCAQFLMQL